MIIWNDPLREKLGHSIELSLDTHPQFTHKLDVCSMYTFTGWLVSNGGGQTDHSLAFFVAACVLKGRSSGSPKLRVWVSMATMQNMQFLQAVPMAPWLSIDCPHVMFFLHVFFSQGPGPESVADHLIQIWGTDSRRTSSHGGLRAAYG